MDMVSYSQLSYNALKKTKNIRNRAIALFKIGYGYYQQNKFQNALTYYKSSEKEATIIQDKTILSSIFRLTSLTFYYLQNYSDALL